MTILKPDQERRLRSLAEGAWTVGKPNIRTDYERRVMQLGSARVLVRLRLAESLYPDGGCRLPGLVFPGHPLTITPFGAQVLTEGGAP